MLCARIIYSSSAGAPIRLSTLRMAAATAGARSVPLRTDIPYRDLPSNLHLLAGPLLLSCALYCILWYNLQLADFAPVPGPPHWKWASSCLKPSARAVSLRLAVPKKTSGDGANSDCSIVM